MRAALSSGRGTRNEISRHCEVNRLLPAEPSDDLDQAVQNLRLALEVGLGGHNRALTHGCAAVQNGLFELIIRYGRLPRSIGVVARLRVERRCGRAVAAPLRAMARRVA